MIQPQRKPTGEDNWRTFLTCLKTIRECLTVAKNDSQKSHFSVKSNAMTVSVEFKRD